MTAEVTEDPEIIKPAWDYPFTEIGKRLKEGKNVVFITEGDPFFFSTYTYLHKAAKIRWPITEKRHQHENTYTCAFALKTQTGSGSFPL